MDDDSLAIHEMAGSRKTTKLSAFLKVENRKKVQIPPSSWRTTAVPLWCVLPYCCAAVVDWSVRTAVVVPLLLLLLLLLLDYCVCF